MAQSHDHRGLETAATLRAREFAPLTVDPRIPEIELTFRWEMILMLTTTATVARFSFGIQDRRR